MSILIHDILWLRPQKGFAQLALIIIIVLILAGAAFLLFRGQPSNFSPGSITQKSESKPCTIVPLKREFNNEPYYNGQFFDAHMHMPQFFKIPDHPEAPVLGEGITGSDVACLFDKDRIKGVFGFYAIPAHLKDKGVRSIKEIDQQYPGKIIPFLEYVVFPGYPVDPKQVEGILNSNQGLFKSFGELSLYLPHYQGVNPNDPQMKDLYKLAEKHHFIVMMHLTESQQGSVEEVLRDFPNVNFLFHGAEYLSWGPKLFDEFLGRYPNAHYSVDIDLFGQDTTGRPLLDCCQEKEEFTAKFKQNWQSNLNKKVAFWKSKIEKYPDQFLWGTDRGAHRWHYDQDVEALLEEYSRAFIGQLDPSVQEKYAYKNAERILQTP